MFRTSRTLTVFAAGFLLLDGALLVLAGAWSRRPSLIAWGAAFTLGALGVGFYWKRHTRHLVELQDDLRAKAQELQRLKRDIEELRQ